MWHKANKIVYQLFLVLSATSDGMWNTQIQRTNEVSEIYLLSSLTGRQQQVGRTAEFQTSHAIDQPGWKEAMIEKDTFV